MGVPADAIIAGGNSSLFLMHLTVETALHYGLWQDQRRWAGQDAPKLATPVPGYDRHFALSEALGVGMVNIDMTDTGPDMAQLLDLVSNDASIKGVWCVPKYANPTGCVYDDATVDAIAELPKRVAADDFVVLWDNAYAVHDLYDNPPQLASIYDRAGVHGTSAHIVQFGSTSKITFAGGGIAFVASDETVLAALEKRMSFMMVGQDKVNQLRHARFLGGRVAEHMQAHAELLRPKFEVVEQVLTEELGGLGHRHLDQASGRLLRVSGSAARAGTAGGRHGEKRGPHVDRRRRHFPLRQRSAGPQRAHCAHIRRSRRSEERHANSDFVCETGHHPPAVARRKQLKRIMSDWKLEEFNIPEVEGSDRFHDFALPLPLMQAIDKLGYEYCTPIQSRALPFALSDYDVTGQAQTGTGKTAAFLIAVFTRFWENPPQEEPPLGCPRALVLAPTRELALQIEGDAKALAKFMDLRTVCVVGGMDMQKQIDRLEKRPVDLLVATPGRLIDFLNRNKVSLKHVEVLVIDEAGPHAGHGLHPRCAAYRSADAA